MPSAAAGKNQLSTARSLAQPVTISGLFYVAGNGASGQTNVLEGFAPDEVRWQSSNTAVATVTPTGDATGVVPGTVGISAIALQGGIIGSVSLAVVQANTTTSVSLTSGTNPSTYGQSLTFTAAVTGGAGTPTGSVSFIDEILRTDEQAPRTSASPWKVAKRAPEHGRTFFNRN